VSCSRVLMFRDRKKREVFCSISEEIAWSLKVEVEVVVIVSVVLGTTSPALNSSFILRRFRNGIRHYSPLPPFSFVRRQLTRGYACILNSWEPPHLHVLEERKNPHKNLPSHLASISNEYD